MNFNYNINSNFNNFNNIDEEMEDMTQNTPPAQIIPHLPPEIWTIIFNSLDDYSLSRVTRVCRQWYLICHEPFFAGWKFLYKALWKEGIPPNHLPSFKHFTSRYRAVGFSTVTMNRERISIADYLSNIRQSKEFLHFIASCRNPALCHSPELLNDLSTPQQIDQWINNIDRLYENGCFFEAHCLIQEIVHIHIDSNQLNKLQKIRNQILTQCLAEHISDENRTRKYSMFKSLFSSFAPLPDFLKELPDAWPIIYGTALYNFCFLMNGFLHNQHPIIVNEGPLLLQTAAESKSFAVLKALLDYSPLKNCLNGSEAREHFPLHALCKIDEHLMDERELLYWMKFVDILLQRGCTLMDRNEENETPYSIAAKHFNPSLLQYLFNKTNAGQAHLIDLQEILTSFTDSLDEQSNEFDGEDYIQCKLTLEILLSIRPSLKDGMRLNTLLFWHLPLFDSLVKFTNKQEQAYLDRLAKVLLNLPKLHVNHLIVNYEEEEELIHESLEEALKTILQKMHVIIPYINHNQVDKQGRTLIHQLITNLRTIEKSLEDADDLTDKKSIFQLCFNHHYALIQQLANKDNRQMPNQKGKTAYNIASAYKYTPLLPLL